MNDERFRVIETAAGWIGVIATPRGLRGVVFPAKTEADARRSVTRRFPHAVEDAKLTPRLVKQLRDYFAGKRVVFDERLDCDRGSAFQTDVWHACMRIGYGQTISYGQLAERVGRPGAARAVGTAMRHNPYPIVVPCHRVIKGDGSLGGYGGAAGESIKRRLLDMEAAAATPRKPVR